MSSGIYLATAGAVAQSEALDTTANNIANASTAGFRADRVTFKQALDKAKSADTAVVAHAGTRVDTQPGTLQATENPLDCALEGEGYFAINTKDGTRYSRAGNFQLDAERNLVTAEGNAVRGDGGAKITIPPDAQVLSIGADGSVSADGVTVGKLELAKFDPKQLRREGNTLYSAAGKPQAGDPPKVHSGMLESSNVNIVRGVVDLVKTSRTYESLMKVIQGYHDVESRAARELGGPK